jgi:hypothetical protein
MNLRLHHYLTRGLINVFLASLPIFVHIGIRLFQKETFVGADFAPEIFFFAVMLGATSVSDSILLLRKIGEFEYGALLLVANLVAVFWHLFLYGFSFYRIDPQHLEESLFSEQFWLFFVIFTITFGANILTIAVVGKFKAK